MSTPPAETRASDRLLTWGFLFVLVLAWAGFMAFGRQRQAAGPAGLAPPASPKQADYRWTLTDLDGAPVAFESFRGRPVFLNIWATWCPPCVSELPSIDRLAADPRTSHVAFLLVSNEDAETVRGFVRNRGLKAPVYLAEGLPRAFLTEGIPATFILDADGRVVVEEVGSSEWDAPHVVDLLAGLGGPE